MSLKDQLTVDLKEAMKTRDEARKNVVKGLRAAIKETEVRNREDLVKKALQKHSVERPRSTSDEDMAGYTAAVNSAIEAEKVDENSLLEDTEILSIIQKLVKQRQDSIAEAEKAGREDIVEAESQELDVLMGYLPKQLSREEVEAEAKAVIAQVGAETKRDMGRVMGPLMGKLQGKADGKLISDVVRSLLN